MSRLLPDIEIFHHAAKVKVDLPWLQQRSQQALPACLAAPGTEPPTLPGLNSIEISLIDDETIAEIHDQFMEDPSPTDVITFHHGEILVSLDTAQREGPAHGHTLEEETLLYIVHGLLHLNGHTDLSSPERETMHRLQNSILTSLLPELT